MSGTFPRADWLKSLENELNTSEEYAKVASEWEGDLAFDIKAQGALKEDVRIYLDLWHGKCRKVQYLEKDEELSAKFILSASYENFVKVVRGDLDPMQALLTRKLSMKGNMGYMMRNVPTVLEFVKRAQAVTDKVVGDE